MRHPLRAMSDDVFESRLADLEEAFATTGRPRSPLELSALPPIDSPPLVAAKRVRSRELTCQPGTGTGTVLAVELVQPGRPPAEPTRTGTPNVVEFNLGDTAGRTIRLFIDARPAGGDARVAITVE